MNKGMKLFWLFFAFNSGGFAGTQMHGGMEGGGGRTVVCRNPDGSVRSAEILDLYEGRTVYRFTYKESSTEWKVQGRDILEAAGISDSVSSSASADIYSWYGSVLENLVFLPVGTSLKPIDDSLEAIIPDGCTLEQTINYQNDRRILVSSAIWNNLSETQKAALIIHEAIYRILRGAGETDSRRARHLTAHIVSGHKIESVYLTKPEVSCRGGSTNNYTYFDVIKLPLNLTGGHPKVRFLFHYLAGFKLMSRMYLDFDLETEQGSNGSHQAVNLLEQLKNPSYSYWMMGTPSGRKLFLS